MAGPLDLMKNSNSAAFVMKDMSEDKYSDKEMGDGMLDSATEELLDVFGLNHDKKDELQKALKNFIKACAHLDEAGDEDEEY